MPKENQKSITVNKAIYEKAQKKAEEEKKSVAGWVTDLIKEKTKEA